MTFGERAAILAHIGWGIALTLAFGLWFHIYTAAGVAFMIAIAKESIESIWGAWDDKQPWSGAVKDVGQFIVGIAAGWILLAMRIVTCR